MRKIDQSAELTGGKTLHPRRGDAIGPAPMTRERSLRGSSRGAFALRLAAFAHAISMAAFAGDVTVTRIDGSVVAGRWVGFGAADGVTVADGHAQHDDIRHNPLILKGIEMRACPAVAGLYLIGDAYTAGLPHIAVNLRQVAFRKEDLPGHTGAALGNKSGQSGIILIQIFDELLNMPGVF